MNKRFFLKLVIYAEVFLVLLGIGLIFFWDYMDAYEASRPRNVMDSYMQALTAERLVDSSAELIHSIDHSVQSEDACKQVIRDSLSGGISYAKNISESTEDEIVYMLLSGGKTVGKVGLSVISTDKYGFTHWSITEESFDMSHLKSGVVTITVPHDYPVFLGGIQLGDNCVTESDIQYPALQEFYGSYKLPHMVTYSAGPILGEPVLSVTAPDGTAVSIDKDTDMSQFLPGCDTPTQADLVEFSDKFVERYVAFISGGNGNLYNNYYKLAQYMIPNGELADRMYEAIAGLSWVTDRGAVVSGIDIHRCVDIGNDRYLCDLTYHVDTTNFSGAIQTSSSIKLIVVQTADGLKAEAMVSY